MSLPTELMVSTVLNSIRKSKYLEVKIKLNYRLYCNVSDSLIIRLDPYHFDEWVSRSLFDLTFDGVFLPSYLIGGGVDFIRPLLSCESNNRKSKNSLGKKFEWCPLDHTLRHPWKCLRWIESNSPPPIKTKVKLDLEMGP